MHTRVVEMSKDWQEKLWENRCDKYPAISWAGKGNFLVVRKAKRCKADKLKDA